MKAEKIVSETSDFCSLSPNSNSTHNATRNIRANLLNNKKQQLYNILSLTVHCIEDTDFQPSARKTKRVTPSPGDNSKPSPTDFVTVIEFQ
jgi:hypothetical protein